jgi:hypothetical protein
MKQTTVRFDDQTLRMLVEIDAKPTTAAQTVTEIFGYLRRATLAELKGIFTRDEIIALADSFNGLMPTWQIMCNASVFAAHTEDAELYQMSASSHGADPVALIDKIRRLTSAQATILQLELVIFWNNEAENSYGSPSPDLEKLIKMLA